MDPITQRAVLDIAHALISVGLDFDIALHQGFERVGIFTDNLPELERIYHRDADQYITNWEDHRSFWA
jgi:hypothetical protein